jgi:hypothetical protein
VRVVLVIAATTCESDKLLLTNLQKVEKWEVTASVEGL